MVNLDRAVADAEVKGVFLRLRSTGIGMAYAQELRLAIDSLQKKGKPVLCHLDAATGAEYYACANASKVLIDPAGGIRLVGPSLTVLSPG
jgi:ClpP class serine protease